MSESHEIEISTGDAEGLYQRIWRDVANVSGTWKIFKQLLASDQETRDLMNQLAMASFTVIQWAMYESVVLGVCRLTDPAETRMGGTTYFNLSIPRLQALADATTREAIQKALKANAPAFEPLRSKRNKQIAHSDSINAEEPPCSRGEIDAAVDALISVMRVVDGIFYGGHVAYEQPVQRGDGEDLISILKECSSSFERFMRGSTKYYTQHSNLLDLAVSDIYNVSSTVVAHRQQMLHSSGDPLLRLLCELYGLTDDDIRLH